MSEDLVLRAVAADGCEFPVVRDNDGKWLRRFFRRPDGKPDSWVWLADGSIVDDSGDGQAPLLTVNDVSLLKVTTASPPTQTGTDRRREILERIASCVCRDRQNNYGDAEDNFKNIADYWTLWLRQRGLLAKDKEVDALDVAQMSAFIKVARKVGNLDYLDNWIDGGGYEVCGAGIILSREGGKP
jgi:hypothetical protein